MLLIRISIALPNVRTPTLPIYIKIVSITLPASETSAVIPVVSATVPRADVVSTSICVNEKCSVNVRTYVPINSIKP